MPSQLTQSAIQRALDWGYETAINGVPNSRIPALGSAEDLARSYLKGRGTLADKASALIGWQTTTAAATGFVSNIGGLITLPVAIPANISIVLLTQLRMIAAIAHMSSYNIRDDQVRSLCLVCLCGSAASDVLKSAGIQIGGKLTTKFIENISFATIKQINQAVGFRMITKFGTTGVINLGKAVPIIGGLVGATFDGTTTAIVGNTAKWIFVYRGSTHSRITNRNRRNQSHTVTLNSSFRSLESLAEQTMHAGPRRTKRYLKTSLTPKKVRK